MNRVSRHLVALVAAGIGFYAGLAAAVAIVGLDGASLSPIFMSAFSGSASGSALGLFDARRQFWARSVAGLVAGLGIGMVVWGADLVLEWAVIGLAVLSQVLAWWSHAK